MRNYSGWIRWLSSNAITLHDEIKGLMEINSKTENKNIEQTAFGILLTVSFCHLLDDTMHSMLPAIYPMLKDEFGLSFLQIGIITFVLQITSSIIQPFVGLYADKHHSWWQLPVSMIFTLIGIFMLSYAKQLLCHPAIGIPLRIRFIHFPSSRFASCTTSIRRKEGD